MRYRLRTLLIVVTILPPVLAVSYFLAWVALSWLLYSRELPAF
jgi:hypothetical protein